jgi:hypothetical protein
MLNYKGIFYDETEEEAGQKYTCPHTGAHFEFTDMSKRLSQV